MLGAATCQAPLSRGFSRQEYWSRLSFVSPGDLPRAGVELMSLALVDRFFITELPRKPALNVGVGNLEEQIRELQGFIHI